MNGSQCPEVVRLFVRKKSRMGKKLKINDLVFQGKEHFFVLQLSRNEANMIESLYALTIVAVNCHGIGILPDHAPE